MTSMTRFSLKDILVGFAITSVGLGVSAFAIRWQIPRLSDWEGVQIMLACLGPWLIAAGVSRPFMKQKTGPQFFIRFVIYAAILVVVLNAIRLQKQIP